MGIQGNTPDTYFFLEFALEVFAVAAWDLWRFSVLDVDDALELVLPLPVGCAGFLSIESPKPSK